MGHVSDPGEPTLLPSPGDTVPVLAGLGPARPLWHVDLRPGSPAEDVGVLTPASRLRLHSVPACGWVLAFGLENMAGGPAVRGF